MFALVRTDLGMSAGKLASQAAHAFLASYLVAYRDCQDQARDYQSIGTIGTKVCLAAPSEHAILRAKAEIEELNLPCALVTDSGHKAFFSGQPTITALGVGPVKKHDIQQIMKRFHLL